MPPTPTDYLGLALAATLIGLGLYTYMRRRAGAREAWLLLVAYNWKLLVWALGLLVLAQQYAWQNDSVSTYYAWAMDIRALLQDKPAESLAYFLGAHRWGVEVGLPAAYVEPRGATQMARLSWLLSYVAGGRYLWMSFLASLLAFGASWYLFSQGRKYLPRHQLALGLAIFGWPSQAYWANGLTKESFVLLGLALLTVGFYRVFIAGRHSFRSWAPLLIGAYLLLTVKVYVFLLLLPAFAVAWLAQHWKKVRQDIGSLLLSLAQPVLVLGLLYVGIGYAYPQFSYGEIGANISQQLAYISSEEEARATSSFLLPAIHLSPLNLLYHYPFLLITGLFRPFIWEAQSPLLLLASAETLLLLLATLYIGFRLGLRTVFRRIISDPLLLGIVVFCLLFFPAITLGSNNFGTLVRYKLPALLGYVYLLLALLRPPISYSTAEEKSSEA